VDSRSADANAVARWPGYVVPALLALLALVLFLCMSPRVFLVSGLVTLVVTLGLMIAGRGRRGSTRWAEQPSSTRDR